MKKILYILLLLPFIGYSQNKPISAMDTILVFSDSMFIPIVDPSEASPSNRNKRFFIRQLSLKYQERSSNLVGLSAMTDVGNMKRNGLGDYSADTVLLKADTVRADAELYVRDSTLLEIIQANAPQVNILNNANNRVTTVTGNANELQAEANLTFDGSTLTLTGTQLTTVQSQISATTNQIRLGTTNTTTITAPAPSASRTYTIPDAGQDAGFGLTINRSGQRIPFYSTTTLLTADQDFRYNAGLLTSPRANLTNTTNQLVFGGATSITINAPTPSLARTYTIPDAGEASDFALTAAGVANRIPYWSSTTRMTNSGNLTFDGTTLGLTGVQTITNSGSTVPLTITKSGSANALVINQTGSGSGLVVTNSGGGVALQAGNISVNGNTIASTSGAITLTPTTNVNISAGNLEVGGTAVINSARQITSPLATFVEAAAGTRVTVLQLHNIGASDGTSVSMDYCASSSFVPTVRTEALRTAAGQHAFVVSTFSGSLAERFRVGHSGIITSLATYNNTTASAANMFVDASGNFFRSTSSRRYKDSIETLFISEDVFKQIRPVSYKSKTDSLQYFGYIAEEIDSIGLKELVTYDTSGNPDALQYGQFTAVNTAMIQKLITRIEELEARVKEFEGN
jgi:hypothetical protein